MNSHEIFVCGTKVFPFWGERGERDTKKGFLQEFWDALLCHILMTTPFFSTWSLFYSPFPPLSSSFSLFLLFFAISPLFFPSFSNSFSLFLPLFFIISLAFSLFFSLFPFSSSSLFFGSSLSSPFFPIFSSFFPLRASSLFIPLLSPFPLFLLFYPSFLTLSLSWEQSFASLVFPCQRMGCP